MGILPISKVCPSCGGSRHRKVRPRRWIAFTSDRVCLECETRYAPPTPRWAGAVFLLVGCLLMLLGLAGLALTVIALVLRGHPDPMGMLLSGGLVVVGALVIWHGARAILFAGRV
jgi:hypothetical protein